MKLGFPAVRLLCLAGLFALSAPALAIDCKKASSAAEKLICSDKKTVAADAELNRAYAAILKQAPDSEVRTMLVESQKRWVAARDRALDTLINTPDALSDDQSASDIARELIQNRTAEFKETQKKSATPAIISRAIAQKQFQAQFTGGAFAGYSTSCDVLPRDYVNYGCFAIRHYQNNDRVCSVDESWASGAVYTKRYVAKVVNGKPEAIASCSFNSEDEACSDAEGKTKWNMSPEQPKHVYTSEPLSKIDGEVFDSDDFAWVKTCLADPVYPPAK
ncbi:lysozyme inhibitor LprI family protein [Achromobacter seleniivolatilans]|uniref:Lysozyme inhibitor LprI family protein n=1 Tax=Achromobacter seleniivolatilans TaxID=3047478 RepID=A0ABY9LUJ6_9BURK|nr:lysozyme inhibitor LprI family protein [Achromobacter sp. R39]WMD18181.1 lysozyme inhibitor LprI family protein [Achromobacter sp. R39]